MGILREGCREREWLKISLLYFIVVLIGIQIFTGREIEILIKDRQRCNGEIRLRM